MPLTNTILVHPWPDRCVKEIRKSKVVCKLVVRFTAIKFLRQWNDPAWRKANGLKMTYTQAKPPAEDAPFAAGVLEKPNCWMPNFDEVPESNWVIPFDGTPEYRMIDQDRPWLEMEFHFYDGSIDDLERLRSLDSCEMTGSKSCWVPAKPSRVDPESIWISDKPIENRYPIYVISKGRWLKEPQKFKKGEKRIGVRMTHNALVEMGVPHRLVVEECEADKYRAAGVPEDTLLVMPPENNNLGQGSIPVRNFIWDHSTKLGYTHHWCIDDNVNGFYRFHNNSRCRVMNAAPFKQVEDIMDRYENVWASAIQYKSFCPDISRAKSNVIVNTRVYSIILIRNSLQEKLGLDERWRGRYNEDTDLSLRILKAGGSLFTFQSFLGDKQTTASCAGGNATGTKEGEVGIYEGNGLYLKAKSLVDQHPDCVTIKSKFGKEFHHSVNYKKWHKNPLGGPEGREAAGTCDEWGLYLSGGSKDYKPKTRTFKTPQQSAPVPEPAAPAATAG